ncbi:aminoacyl-tRNA deacylase [Fodinicola acaciae]|uniref:aminoacyl-tRNA deacylase n=1 Tax=Fodinicola acaciae TaxID=2681555 RepID=UPI0013D2E0F2|nr:YbaK/EbsC family protein [Fodinicola acaciae]
MDNLTQKIESRLKELGVAYKLSHHEPVATSADAARVRGVALSSGAKALLVKANEVYALFVVPANRQLDWRAVKATLTCKNARLATEEELLEKTGLIKGSVPPFGNLLGLPVYVDGDLGEEELVRFNAGSLTSSIEMPGGDLLNAVEGEWGSYSKPPKAE